MIGVTVYILIIRARMDLGNRTALTLASLHLQSRKLLMLNKMLQNREQLLHLRLGQMHPTTTQHVPSALRQLPRHIFPDTLVRTLRPLRKEKLRPRIIRPKPNRSFSSET
jgi:hypothetical protein